MSTCDWLSDRMPSVALEQVEWTPEEARHLAECPSCQAEWALVQTTSRLASAERLVRDPDSTARAVLFRLKRQEARRPTRVWGLSGLAAAAIAAVVWMGGPETPAAPAAEGTAVAAALPMSLPELEVLQPAELESVLQSLEDSFSSDPSVEDVGLGDLDSVELQRVLDTWEG